MLWQWQLNAELRRYLKFNGAKVGRKEILTPEEHNKYLAYSHLGYAALFLLMISAFLVLFGVMFFAAISKDPNGPPVALLFIFWLFFAAIYGAMIVPSFIAAYALLRKKKWAKTAAIIAGVFAAMQFPVGTAVCVYTFWFLFSEPGKLMFDKPGYVLSAGRQTWANDLHRQKEIGYAPPLTPPDWR
jgi:hypothetical protein